MCKFRFVWEKLTIIKTPLLHPFFINRFKIFKRKNMLGSPVDHTIRDDNRPAGVSVPEKINPLLRKSSINKTNN